MSWSDHVGVNVHMSYYDQPYADLGAVRDALRYLGVLHGRDGPHNHDAHNYLAAMIPGYRLCLIASTGTQTPDLWQTAITLGGVCDLYESDNEPDIAWPRPDDWWGVAKAHTQQLRESLGEWPILAPSVVWARAEVGEDPSATAANFHPYTGGQPETVPHLEAEINGAHVTAPDRPLYATEFGWHNAVNQQGGHPPATESDAARWLPGALMDHIAHGIERTYLYELVDGQDNPQRDRAEANFGLFRYDWTPKPIARTLRCLMLMLAGYEPVGEDDAPVWVTDPSGAARFQVFRNGARRFLLIYADRDVGSRVMQLWSRDSAWRDFGMYLPATRPVPWDTVRWASHAQHFAFDLGDEPALIYLPT